LLVAAAGALVEPALALLLPSPPHAARATPHATAAKARYWLELIETPFGRFGDEPGSTGLSLRSRR
jgi:hypothetical protein